jgi:hypothetical protein
VRRTGGPAVPTQDLDMRYRLDIFASSVVDVVRFVGGWLFDRVMAGWDVTVIVAEFPDGRPVQILGAGTLDHESTLASMGHRPRPQTVAVASDLFGSDLRVRKSVLQALGDGLTEVTLLGDKCPAAFGHRVDPVQYQLSSAARVFKVQALMAAAAPVALAGSAETFLTALTRRQACLTRVTGLPGNPVA